VDDFVKKVQIAEISSSYGQLEEIDEPSFSIYEADLSLPWAQDPNLFSQTEFLNSDSRTLLQKTAQPRKSHQRKLTWKKPWPKNTLE